MLLRFFIPLVYCLLMGLSWSFLFKKKFYDSLAPAFIAHTLFVIIVGLLFERLSVGIYLGICVMIISSIIVFIHRKIAISKDNFKKACYEQINNGVILFLILYLGVFVLNTGKVFLTWDEFSHWGVFLKESLRLDNFYATSNLSFAHKDYVPAFTIFEVIYCKISDGFTCPQAYRAMQVLGFALMMPMFGRIIDFCNERREKFKNFILLTGTVFFVLITPFVYHNSDGFQFYHTIYCDYILGILFFYLVYIAYQKHENTWYQTLLLTMGISMFVLAKMTAMALFPMVIVLLIAIRVVLGNASKGNIVTYVPQLLVPMGLWAWFNSFVHRYVDTSGNIQSYGSIKLSSILDVFGNAETSGIPYIETLRRNYISAIFTRDIWIKGSYMVILFILVAVIASMAFYVSDSNEKKKIVVASGWTFVFGIAYAILMYFLYATSFTENEAIDLASYERYMNTFLVTVVLFAIAVYYESKLWMNNGKTLFTVIVALSVLIFVFNVDRVTQAVPGVLTHEDEYVQAEVQNSQIIMANTDDGSSVFVEKRGDSGYINFHLTFYCDNRIIGGYSAGPAVNEYDGYSQNVSVEQFVENVSSYDYIYFYEVDDAFIETYADAFVDVSKIYNMGIYKVSVVDGKIDLE